MNRSVVALVVAIVVLSLLVSAGPTIVAILNAAVPLVIVGGLVAAVLRVVFFHTRRW
jgi:hypothetical protein